MFDNERTWAVKRLLFEFVKSPSLKHIRDEHSITRLFRVAQVADAENGTMLGRYRGRGEATKAISEMAYKPEPRY